ncbi:hypothetical protein CPB85DRAFT_1436408 [Mucidula mucida]|nr:hypothetical protein CPB85DRAFT_1436408 [Mucidula mucida]
MSSQSSVSTVSDPGVKHTQPVEESVEPTAHAAISLADPAICTATAAGDEAMYAVVNRFLERIQWIQLMAWKTTPMQRSSTSTPTTTGLTITQGSEVTAGFNLGASYEGIHLERTTTITVSVPPRSELVFYQKRFTFRDEITFINDAWGQEWNIGPWGGYSPLTTKVSKVNVMAEEYFTSSARLPEGPGSVM